MKNTGAAYQQIREVHDALLGAQVAPVAIEPPRYYAEIAGCAGVWGIGATPADALNDLQGALEEWTLFRHAIQESRAAEGPDLSDVPGAGALNIRKVWPEGWIRQLKQNGFEGPFPVQTQSFMRKDHLAVRVPPESEGQALRPVLAKKIARQTGVGISEFDGR